MRSASRPSRSHGTREEQRRNERTYSLRPAAFGLAGSLTLRPAVAADSTPLTLSRVFWLWLPLAASWALMTAEYPIIQGSLSRLPRVDTMLAAASLVIGLEITIEAPVIMLLATTTALARGPASFRILRRFMIHLNLGCSAVAAVVAFVDPVYDLIVRGALGIPETIAYEARPAFGVMVLWSAAIGWRRFYQGILIRAGRTRLIGAGTLVRLVGAAGTAVGLAAWGGFTGVVVGGCAWMTGVAAEALFIRYLARHTVRERYGPDVPDEESPPTYREVALFHLPLAATSVMSLLAMPVLQAGIARMPEPEHNLAAWPVVFAIVLFFRSPGFALPEVVIALLDGARRVAVLRTFALLLAAATVLGLAVFAVTPLLSLYLEDGVDVPAHLLPYVLPGLLAGMVLPALQALQSWWRGTLMAARRTVHVYWGMGIALLTTGLATWGAVVWQADGVVAAALALAAGMVLEGAYLARRSHAAVATL